MVNENTLLLKKKNNISKFRINLEIYNKKNAFTPIIFNEIELKAHLFYQHIKKNYNNIVQILLNYETFEVANDEIERTLDLFSSLNENKSFFILRIGSVASFLPKNQPLYALSCFVIIPSLMAENVFFRIPHSMRHFFDDLLDIINFTDFFPNIVVSRQDRLDFLRERSSLYFDQNTKETAPVTDAVIFTGTSNHAEQLRMIFDKKTLFIANGSGHNPIVVSQDANMRDAANAAIKLQLYNQGQDCAAPNSILVDKNIYSIFLENLKEKLSKVQIGLYKDINVTVGPISDPKELVRLQNLLVLNRNWLDPNFPGIIDTKLGIMYPAIICKPLIDGGNFDELFAPIFFIQSYDNDDDLSLYFENENYARNAMYISLYGNSRYIHSLKTRLISGKILHDDENILLNKHLHERGVERGTQPYGGYGYAASSISINGVIKCQPTLPQRDIYNELVKPLINLGIAQEKKMHLAKMDKIISKNIDKVLRMKKAKSIESVSLVPKKFNYIDLDKIDTSIRFLRLQSNNIITLLDEPNLMVISELTPDHLEKIRKLHSFLLNKKVKDSKLISDFLYSITKDLNLPYQENIEKQLCFFKKVYELLFGKIYGPRLANFLAEADRDQVLKLINI